MWFQKQVQLRPYHRGFHLVTTEITEKLPELKNYKTGLCHIFLPHTSASLTLNENADPNVRHDMEAFSNHYIPENEEYFLHVIEGSDDMPAHIKSSLFGADVMIPIADGWLVLAIWQGIWLGEHRDCGGSRHLIITLQGEGYT
ncbi:secondary thiamine-phosphate synthase enzyme YjbQ [Endozoicomonas sp. SCSIO W0465]|nr:secondary thiamine-phosphate synthase enzyme YjbQ [Endozoicomonas sp. SCSIO W0465]USE39652.1 secondary thiamine-phosphate synthase enzyme YjbQ [Endozoicomonas sp. SCSIO W0465]